MRRLVLVVAVLVLLVVALAELLAPRVVERVVAERVRSSAGLAAEPEVAVRGRPFLLQAVRGRYDEVEVRAREVPAGRLAFESLTARLTAVEVPLRDAVARTVRAVPVGLLSTRAVVGYDDLTGLVADRGLSVSPADSGLVRVTGRVEVLGRTLEAAAVSRPQLDGRTLVVTAERFEVGNDLADTVLSRALGRRFDFRVELDALPYGLQVRSLDARPEGVVVLADAPDAVLPAG